MTSDILNDELEKIVFTEFKKDYRTKDLSWTEMVELNKGADKDACHE
jgi:hypothetical protein